MVKRKQGKECLILRKKKKLLFQILIIGVSGETREGSDKKRRSMKRALTISQYFIPKYLILSDIIVTANGNIKTTNKQD